MTSLSVAIIKSDFHDNHSTAWGNVWLNACIEQGIKHELIEWRALNAFDRMRCHNVVLWHFSHYSAEEMKFARPILSALKAAGCFVFPDQGDAEHFDDKVAQSYLLEALDLPTPKNYSLHSLAAVNSWIDEVGIFPVVAKLRAGSGSSNVILINSVGELRRYAARMFGRGFRSRPSIIFKMRSNLSSSHSLSDILKRAKRIPEFLFSWLSASGLGFEKGYVYLQEFIPNIDHDLKIVVVGDKLSFICRSVRKNDFRASGGGSLFYDRSYISKAVIEAAFNAADQLRSDCTGFDFVVDPRTQRPLIIEVSYGFSHSALLNAEGYYDRNAIWHDSPMNAPVMLLERIISKVSI